MADEGFGGIAPIQPPPGGIRPAYEAQGGIMPHAPNLPKGVAPPPGYSGGGIAPPCFKF